MLKNVYAFPAISYYVCCEKDHMHSVWVYYLFKHSESVMDRKLPSADWEQQWRVALHSVWNAHWVKDAVTKHIMKSLTPKKHKVVYLFELVHCHMMMTT